MLHQLYEIFQQGSVDSAFSIARQELEQQQAQGNLPGQIGLEIARCAATAYRDFITEPVHQFQQRAEKELPGEAGSIVQKALKRLMDQVFDWEQRLELVYRERLARELRDFTRAHNYHAAAENIRLLSSAARSEEDSGRIANYIGNILGTCENHPREVDSVIALLEKSPTAFALTHQLITDLKDARRKRADLVMRGRMETREIEWMRTLTQTVVDIKNQLPAHNLMEEPNETVLRDVGDLFRAVLRIPLWRNQSEKLIDATLLLLEFVPKELAAAAAQSGLEQRAYMTLGYTAKKAALLTFAEIGKSIPLVRAYETAARILAGSPYLKSFIELMGAMHSPVFYPFLVECYEDKRLVAVRGELVDALGNLGNADARNLLISTLEEILSARVIDPPRMRGAERILTALGKLSRSPRLTPAERSDLVRQSIKPIPPAQLQLSLLAALRFFSYNSDPLPEELKRWAVGVLTEALWLPDTAPEWVKGAERQESILGYRHETTEVLKRLVPDTPKPFLECAERMAIRYSGAFLAIAEVCEKARLRQAVPILEKMLLTSLLHNEQDANRYEVETYWDASVQQRVPLNKEKVVAPIVFAIGTAGGHEALVVLTRLDDQIKSGRMQLPGPETARHLMTFLQRLTEEEKALEAVLPEEAGTGETSVHGTQFSPQRLDGLIKTLTASYFLVGAEKRRLRKIAAISELAQFAHEKAIQPLLSQLADKDTLVQGAARTALLEYMSRHVPSSTRQLFLDAAVQALADKDPAMSRGAAQMLCEIGLNHPELQTVFTQFLETTQSTDLRKQISLLLKEKGPGARPAGAPGGGVVVKPGLAPLPAAGANRATPSTGAMPPAATGAASNALDLKRQYVIARQEWIRGGKKGPPPEPPPGT